MAGSDASSANALEGAYNANPEGLRFWTLVAEDFATHGRAWCSQGFWALFWHRFGNWRMSVRQKPLRAPLTLLYRIMFKATEIFCGIMLPYSVPIGRRLTIEHFGGVIISATRIGDDVTIRQNTTIGVASKSSPRGRPTIGDGVDIGAGAVILGNITIGRGAVIGANAVVISDIPDFAVAVGVPARVVKIQSAPVSDEAHACTRPGGEAMI